MSTEVRCVFNDGRRHWHDSVARGLASVMVLHSSTGRFVGTPILRSPGGRHQSGIWPDSPTRDRRGSLSRCPASTMLGLCTYRSSALIRAAGSHRPIRAESERESAKQIHIKGARFHPGPLPVHPLRRITESESRSNHGTSDPAVFGRLIRS
jgi:hypothetical protein